MAKTVKVGVLGYGFVQETFHLPCYQEIPNATVVAIGGRNKEKANLIAKKFGVKRVYHGEDFSERLCSDSEIDVVDIGLPNFLHKKASEISAENGKHVICEKPLARNVDEAESAWKTVEKHCVTGCYGRTKCFVPI